MIVDQIMKWAFAAIVSGFAIGVFVGLYAWIKALWEDR